MLKTKFLPDKGQSVFSGWVIKSLLIGLFLFCSSFSQAQISIEANATFDPTIRIFFVKQSITYKNTSLDTLKTFYFNDWNNAFQSKVSPLGEHFSSGYIRQFYFSKRDDRGETKIDFIRDVENENLKWSRPNGYPDIVKVPLEKKILPGDTIKFNLQYTLRIPLDKFTGYGRDADGNYVLRHWMVLHWALVGLGNVHHPRQSHAHPLGRRELQKLHGDIERATHR